MSIHARLRLLRKTLGYTQEKMGVICGIKKSAYSMIENGYTQLSARNRQFLIETLGVNMVWLDEGEGDMFGPESSVFENIDERAKYAREQARIVPLYNFDTVGRLPDPDGNSRYIRGYVAFDGAEHDDVAFTMVGNSMAPTMPAGAVVLLRRLQDWNAVVYGKPYLIILDDGRRLLRRICRCPDAKKSESHFLLRATNRAFEPGMLPIKMISAIFAVKAVCCDVVFR